MKDQRVAHASKLMGRFAERTSLTTARHGPRHLWTDAFAVCNLLALARASGDASFELLAAELISKVHQSLGRHRAEDPRQGWLSGLSEAGGEDRPTVGGLRIGNPLPERSADEPFEHEREWERDGQYFHHLTKWILALDRMTWRTHDVSVHRWALDLVHVARDAFIRGPDGERRLVWKMSLDLSRPLVDMMSPHDPIDGYIACVELDATTKELGMLPLPALAIARNDFAGMIARDKVATGDPAAVGELLLDAWRLAQVDARAPLVSSLLRAARAGIETSLESLTQRRRRLAFRELGLAIGLAAAATLAEENAALDPAANEVLDALNDVFPVRREIEDFWLEGEQQQSALWVRHQNINEVMLATSLCPEGVLGADRPRLRATPDAPNLSRTIADCIDVCLDAERVFSVAAADAHSPHLRTLLQGYAKDRAAFARVLRDIAARRRRFESMPIDVIPPEVRTMLVEQRAAIRRVRDTLASEQRAPA